MANVIKLGGGAGSAVLVSKSITTNGTYNASADNADGYSTVSVSVPSAGVDYIEAWILKSQNTTTTIPTITTHLTFTSGVITSFEVKENAGNASVVCGDLTTYIGDASGYKWLATATDNMTYKICDIVNGTMSALQTATSGTQIITDGAISAPFCVEIRRYS